MLGKNNGETRLADKGEVLGRLLIRPFQEFVAMEVSSGALLLAATAVAVLCLNSSLGHHYESILNTPVNLGVGPYSLNRTLHFWINDGLMSVFFFVVGLEIKREMLVGELASFRRAILPVAAAVGGMLVPAAVYAYFNWGTPAEKGWGIPMATDIAFTLGALTLLGSRIPHSLKVFLVALAIADDLGAVLVIALFYTSDASLYHLGMAGVVVAALALINFLGYRRPLPYVILGLILWLMVLLSGVHATVAGVILAVTIPARSRYDTDTFLNRSNQVLNEFQCAGSCGFSMYTNEDHQTAVHALERMCHHVMPPLDRLAHALQPWVAFVIVPLFALTNAGVHLEWSKVTASLASPLSIGIVAGLFVGKQLGILAAAWLAIRTGVAEAPRGVTMPQLYGGGLLCGIGFTMSIFIAEIAFHGSPLLDTAKLSVFVGSILSFVAGTAILFLVTDKSSGTKDNDAGMTSD